MLYDSVPADTVVYEEGDAAEHLFILLQGSVAVHKKHAAKVQALQCHQSC